MSGNKLEDKIFFEDGHTLGYLPNLTVLELDGNKFTKLPVANIILHKGLRKLNVQNNVKWLIILQTLRTLKGLF